MIVVSRAKAKAAGLTRYFTGKPCKHGHVCERFVSNKHCVACDQTWRAANPEKVRARNARWYEANLEKHRAATASWQRANPEKVREKSARWYAANRERVLAKRTGWRAANPEKARAADAARRRAYPEKINALNQRRRARKQNALCDCCTSADFQSVYDLARLAGFEVDHIEPLALGGKHCRRNLQLMTPEAHKAKTASDKRRIAEVRQLL